MPTRIALRALALVAAMAATMPAARAAEHHQDRDRPDRRLGQPGATLGHGRHLRQARPRAGEFRHPGRRRDHPGGDLGLGEIGIGIGTAGHAGVRARRAVAHRRRLCGRRRPVLVRAGEFAAQALADATGIRWPIRPTAPPRTWSRSASPSSSASRPSWSRPAARPAYTSTMSGQIDIGWAVVPFGLAALQEGKIRVIARGPDVPTLRNQTIRVQIVNATRSRRART